MAGSPVARAPGGRHLARWGGGCAASPANSAVPGPGDGRGGAPPTGSPTRSSGRSGSPRVSTSTPWSYVRSGCRS